MKRNHKRNIQAILQKISDILLINGGFLDNQGLYSGEIGLVLFFTHYARYTKNDLYLEYSCHLLEKVQKRIHMDSIINYKQGLTGIGSSIEYLVQNGFFEADTDEILEDFDRRIFFTYNISFLLINEIMSIGYYTKWRLSGNSSKKEIIQKTILPSIEIALQNYSLSLNEIQINNIKAPSSFQEKTYDNCLDLISKYKFWNKGMGIQEGLAGWGLSLLTELDSDDSWFSILPDYFNNIME